MIIIISITITSYGPNNLKKRVIQKTREILKLKDSSRII